MEGGQSIQKVLVGRFNVPAKFGYYLLIIGGLPKADVEEVILFAGVVGYTHMVLPSGSAQMSHYGAVD